MDRCECCWDAVDGWWHDENHWAGELFANSPRDGRRARVCRHNGRVLHVEAGGHRVDVPMMADDETGFLRYTCSHYCTRCGKIEATYYYDDTPDTPLIWIECN